MMLGEEDWGLGMCIFSRLPQSLILLSRKHALRSKTLGWSCREGRLTNLCVHLLVLRSLECFPVILS